MSNLGTVAAVPYQHGSRRRPRDPGRRLRLSPTSPVTVPTSPILRLAAIEVARRGDPYPRSVPTFGRARARRRPGVRALRSTLPTIAIPSSDAELVSRLVAGDGDVLREVYRTHAPAVYGLAVRILASEALAEEVTQDVFVRLWEQPTRFDSARGPLRAYLLAMTHSRAVERVRKEESQRRRTDAARRQPPVDEPLDPAEVTADRDEGQAVRRALRELPDDQRVAIEIAYFEGLSYREVADRQGVAEGTVKYRIRSGMQKMKAALQAAEVTP